jgi:hypothetical protein
VSGTTLIAGAPNANGPKGRVFVHTKNGSWSFNAEVLPDATVLNGSQFGWSVALDGDSALVGSRGWAPANAGKKAGFGFDHA